MGWIASNVLPWRRPLLSEWSINDLQSVWESLPLRWRVWAYALIDILHLSLTLNGVVLVLGWLRQTGVLSNSHNIYLALTTIQTAFQQSPARWFVISRVWTARCGIINGIIRLYNIDWVLFCARRTVLCLFQGSIGFASHKCGNWRHGCSLGEQTLS